MPPICSRFRVLFVHLIPCVSLIVLNTFLFNTMREAEKRREQLLQSKAKSAAIAAAAAAGGGGGGQAAAHAAKESRETRKIRDSNSTTFMLITVITVRSSSNRTIKKCITLKLDLYLTLMINPFQMFLAVEVPLGVITILHTVSSTMYDFLNYEVMCV